MAGGYDAFISYSHAADGALAPAIQRGLTRLAKPWYRREALRIFRDDTGLAVTPELWASIVTALDGCEHFVLLASPEAATSAWVNREIEHWKSTKSMASLLPVVTGGEWIWDDRAEDLDAQRSTAVPEALYGAFSEEPRHLDLRWARTEEHLDLRNGRFRNAVAELAAPVRGVPKEELESEDLRLHRHAMRLARAGITGLVVLTVAAVIAGILAITNANRAEDRRVEATARQLSAEALSVQRDSPVEGLMLGAAAHTVRPTESVGSLLELVQSRPRLARFLDTAPGSADTSVVVSDDGRHAAFIRTRGATTTAVIAPLGPGPTVRRTVRGLEQVWFVDDRHVALVGDRLSVMDLDGSMTPVVARRPHSSWAMSPDRGHAVVIAKKGSLVVVDLRHRKRRASVTPSSPDSARLVAFEDTGAQVLVSTARGWQLLQTDSSAAGSPVVFPPEIGTVNPRLLPTGAAFGAGEHGLAVAPTDASAAAPVVIPLDATDGQYVFQVSHDGRLALVRTQSRLFLVQLDTGLVVWQRPATGTAQFAGTAAVGFRRSDDRVYDVGPDGLTIATTATGDVVRRIATITTVHVDPDAQRVVADSLGYVDVVDLQNGDIVAERAGVGPANVVAWSPNGRYLVTAGVETVLWDLARKPVTTEPLTVSTSFTLGAAVSAEYAVTAGSETVALWRLGAVVPYGNVAWTGHTDELEALDADGRGGVRIRETSTGYAVADLSGATRARIRRAGASVIDATLLWGGRRALVQYGTETGSALDLVDLEHGRVVRTGAVCGATSVDQVTPNADGRHLLATIDPDTNALGGEQLELCRATDGRRIAHMTPRSGVTGSAGPSRHGDLAAFPAQGAVHVVDLRRRREVERFAMPGPARWPGRPGRAVFASDDRRIVAEWYFGAVVHDRLTGRTRAVRRSHVNRTWLPQRIDVDPTGRVAAVSAAAVGGPSGTLASELSLVDLETMHVLGPVQLPSLQLVTSVRVDPTGRRVDVTGVDATTGTDTHGAELRFSLADSHLADLACRLLAHAPSHAEWEERLPTTDYVAVCRGAR
ncbi:MAG TPA: hypothetical protein VIH82_13680 [Acidimicrobiia bacterium]